MLPNKTAIHFDCKVVFLFRMIWIRYIVLLRLMRPELLS